MKELNKTDTSTIDSTLRDKIFLYSILSMATCVYALIYNQTENYIYDRKALHGAPALYLSIQYFGFIFPLCGFLTGFLFKKIRLKKYVNLLPDMLLVFSLAWVALCILVWEMQKVPIYGLNGLKLGG